MERESPGQVNPLPHQKVLEPEEKGGLPVKYIMNHHRGNERYALSRINSVLIRTASFTQATAEYTTCSRKCLPREDYGAGVSSPTARPSTVSAFGRGRLVERTVLASVVATVGPGRMEW